ncbi:MAG: hypothetical protein ABSC94_25080 [Polyangiaceae bacterium]
MTDVEPSKALYYPHPAFTSVACVKRALLYWDGIVRLAHPRVAPPNDGPEIRELAAAGLIESVPFGPDSPHWNRSAGIFLQRVDNLLRSHGDGVLQSMPELCGLRGVPPEAIRTEIDEHAQGFHERGYAAAARAIRAKPLTALGLCFTVFANVAAWGRHVSPVTDEPYFQAITSYIDSTKLAEDLKDIEPAERLAAAQLYIPTPSPETVAPLSVSSLLKIRKQYAAQRRSFREKVQAHTRAIARLPNAEAVRDHMSAFATEIQDEMSAARQAMRETSAVDRWALLGVSAPTSLAAGLAIAQASTPVVGALGAAGSLTLAVTRWFMQKRRRESARDQHYLLSLETAIGSRDHLLSNALHRLTRG